MRLVSRLLGKLSHFLPCILTSALGISVTLTVVAVMVAHDDRDAETQFRAVAENHFMVLQNGVNETVSRLRAVRALFDSSPHPITRAEFESFARPLLHENTAIATLSWVPRVPGPDRAENEREGVLQGLPGYHIKGRGLDGKLYVSPEKNEYYPVFYATVPRTSPLYGLDLSSEPATLAELELASDTDRLGFSRIKLISTGRGEQGFIFSLPIYKHGSFHNSVAERRRDLVGFVHGSLVTAKMIGQIIRTNNAPAWLDLFFFNPHAGAGALPEYIYGADMRAVPVAPISLMAAQAGTSWIRDLTADGKPFLTVVARPTPGGPLSPGHSRAWIVLIFGLIITAALVAYIRSSRSHAFCMMQVNRKVSDLAQTDALTSLANRRAFLTRLHAAFAACRRGGRPFAVLYFDLDHFKDVNDTLGHAIGDELLRQVADRVTSAIRKTDVVARFGGDEFAILQSDVDVLAAAGALAAKLGRLIAVPYRIDGNEVHTSASIGVSCYSAEVDGPDAMLMQADLALYRAKEDGRNCFRFHNSDLDRDVQERVIIAEELRGAIERGELDLHYQPQVELRSGRIVGLEALMRGNHPKRGRIPPSVFIPIAERTGQILQLGRWALDAACRQLRSWEDAGVAPELVGVNISALHFKGSTELDRDVAAVLEKWRIAPAKIEIELTETVLMDITQQHNDRFERLRLIGVRIAVDDFGTGYSSLNYLANYPINRVKIAQELVAGADTDSRNGAVVRAAVRLARELGIEIIAEGVETEGQAQFLLAAGCEHAQGFYLGVPRDAAETTALLGVGRIMPARGPLRLVKTTAA